MDTIKIKYPFIYDPVMGIVPLKNSYWVEITLTYYMAVLQVQVEIFNKVDQGHVMYYKHNVSHIDINPGDNYRFNNFGLN
jgi:hypothetical protein